MGEESFPVWCCGSPHPAIWGAGCAGEGQDAAGTEGSGCSRVGLILQARRDRAGGLHTQVMGTRILLWDFRVWGTAGPWDGPLLGISLCPGSCAESRLGSSHNPARMAGLLPCALLARCVLIPCSAPRREMAAGSRLLLLLLLPWLAAASHSPPGCKIRITSKGLDLGKGLARTLLPGRAGSQLARWDRQGGLCW